MAAPRPGTRCHRRRPGPSPQRAATRARPLATVTRHRRLVLRRGLSVDARSGRVSAASVEVANVGDEGEVTCLESAFDAVSLPAGPPELAGRAELSLPIRFAH